MEDDDNPLKMHPFDAVTIPALLVLEGQHGSASVTEAGIYDPVSIPITFDMAAAATFGNGFTENLPALFTPEEEDSAALDDEEAEPEGDAGPVG